MIKWLGFLAVIILAFAGAWVVRRNGVFWEKSLSQHVGLGPRTFVHFAVASTTAIVLFYVFMQEWFIPTFQPPALFHYAMLAGLACQLVAAWVSHAEDPRAARIHQTFAYTMAAIMPCALLLLLFSSAMPDVGKWVAGIASLVMAIEYLLYRTVQTMQKRYFLYQTIYIVLFYVAILVVTYIDA
jgi:hypothetical protein